MDGVKLEYGFLVNEPVATDIQEIEIEINPTDFLEGYSRAFIDEAQRLNPLMFDAHPLKEDELKEYFTYLISERIKSVHRNCPDWKNLKLLWIPDWIQYVISLIGTFTNYEFGLKFIPIMDETVETITFDQAYQVSEKLNLYSHSLGMHKDAMPRKPDGDEDVMSCALISNRVKATKKLAHPESSYVAAFAGLTLRKETALNILYRVTYDDISYIRSDFLSNRKVVTG